MSKQKDVFWGKLRATYTTAAVSKLVVPDPEKPARARC